MKKLETSNTVEIQEMQSVRKSCLLALDKPMLTSCHDVIFDLDTVNMSTLGVLSH